MSLNTGPWSFHAIFDDILTKMWPYLTDDTLEGRGLRIPGVWNCLCSIDIEISEDDSVVQIHTIQLRPQKLRYHVSIHRHCISGLIFTKVRPNHADESKATSDRCLFWVHLYLMDHVFLSLKLDDFVYVDESIQMKICLIGEDDLFRHSPIERTAGALHGLLVWGPEWTESSKVEVFCQNSLRAA